MPLTGRVAAVRVTGTKIFMLVMYDKEKTAAHLKLKYLKYDEVYYYLRILIN